MATETLTEKITIARARFDGGAPLSKADLGFILSVHIRSVERLVKAGKLPEPDLIINKGNADGQGRVFRWTNKVVRPALERLGLS